MLKARIAKIKNTNLIHSGHYFNVFSPCKRELIFDNKSICIYIFDTLIDKLYHKIKQEKQISIYKVRSLSAIFFSTLFTRLQFYLQIVEGVNEKNVCNFCAVISNKHIISAERGKTINEINFKTVLDYMWNNLKIENIVQQEKVIFFIELK